MLNPSVDDDLVPADIIIKPTLTHGHVEFSSEPFGSFQLRTEEGNKITGNWSWDIEDKPLKVLVDVTGKSYFTRGPEGIIIYYWAGDVNHGANALDHITYFAPVLEITHCPKVWTPGKDQIIRFLHSYEDCPIAGRFEIFKRDNTGNPYGNAVFATKGVPKQFQLNQGYYDDSFTFPSKQTLSAGRYVVKITLTYGAVTRKCVATAPFDVPGIPPYYEKCAPIGPDGVNWATGSFEAGPIVDIEVPNPKGPSVKFAREYHSNLAMIGYGSPGLSPGWVHNYDIKIMAQKWATTQTPLFGEAETQEWGPLTLCFPDGTETRLVPLMNKKTHISGYLYKVPFKVDPGTPMIVNGTASIGKVDVSKWGPGIWTDITIEWTNRDEQCKWVFIHSNTGFITSQNWDGTNIYELHRIEDSITHDAIYFNWTPDMQLISIQRPNPILMGEPITLLDFRSDGLTAPTIDRKVVYSNRAPAANPPPGDLTMPYLEKVSQPVPLNFTGPLDPWKHVYNYESVQALTNYWSPRLTAISSLDLSAKNLNPPSYIPKYIQYDAQTGRVSQITFAKGAYHNYAYNDEKCIMTAHMPNSPNPLRTETYEFDSKGRITSIIIGSKVLAYSYDKYNIYIPIVSVKNGKNHKGQYYKNGKPVSVNGQ